MTDQTAMEIAESRMTDQARWDLEKVRRMFDRDEITLDDLSAYLRHNLHWDVEAAREYCDAAADAADHVPAAPACPNAQLASPEPVERLQGKLTPRYGPRPAA
jgi:hypothetical protein